jgi:hypothetical protein
MPGMPLPRLKICSLLALALLVGGCGSSHSGSTTTTTGSAPTTGPSQAGGSPGASAPTATSGSTQRSQPSPTGIPSKPVEFKEEGSHASEATRMKVREKETGVPVKRQYPTSLQASFTSTCTAAGGSHAACECIIKTLELSSREKGFSLAELLATDVGLRRTSYEAIVNKTPGLGPAGGPVQVPGDAFKAMHTCKAAK